MVCDLAHAFDGGMAGDLVDGLELDDGHMVMGSDGLYRLVDFLAQVIVQDEVDLRIDITVRHPLEHTRQGRTEVIEVGQRDTLVFILPDGRASPAVVSGSKDKDNVWLSDIVHTGVERTGTVVVAVVARIADGGTAVGVVHTESPAVLADHLMPPRLTYVLHIRFTLAVLGIIPQFVGARCHKILIGGVRVAKH